MALRTKSLFLYGLQITENNQAIDFKAASGGAILRATLRLGYYSLTSLCLEVARAMAEVDPDRIYTVTADRTFAAGLENRVTIVTNGSYLSLLFAPGSDRRNNVAPLIGFNPTDYTGALTYTGAISAGISLIPDRVGYNYVPPDNFKKVQGSVSESASGEQETITFGINRFWQVEFKFEPETKVKTEWADMMTWIIQHRLIEFTPESSDPSTFYEGTIESTSGDSKGLGYKMTEQLPDFPFRYMTGQLTFRVRNRAAINI